MNNQKALIAALFLLVGLLTFKISSQQSEINNLQGTRSEVLQEKSESTNNRKGSTMEANIRDIVAEVLASYQMDSMKSGNMSALNPESAKISSSMVKIMMGVLARYEGSKITNDPSNPIAPLPDVLAGNTP